MEEQKNIYKALVSFQKDCPVIDLDAEVEVATKSGGKYKFKYATLANIVKKIRPVLTENGLGFMHLVTNEGVICTLFHESGESIQSLPYKVNTGSSAQDQGSSITYGRRYTLSAVLGIVTEEDVDAPQGDGRKSMSEKAFDSVVKRILEGSSTVVIETLFKTFLHFSLSDQQREQLLELSLQRVEK